MKYAVLLRGVNVSGRNRVSKAEFQATLEALGFDDIVIYLNSGNAVFTSKEPPDVVRIQAALETHFGFPIPTLLFSGERFKSIATAIPENWVYDSPNPSKIGSFSHVIFLFDEVDSPKLIEDMGYDSEQEGCIYVPGAILHTVYQTYWTKSWLTKLMGTEAYNLVSVRNINTVHKLAELVGR